MLSTRQVARMLLVAGESATVAVVELMALRGLPRRDAELAVRAVAREAAAERRRRRWRLALRRQGHRELTLLA